MSDAADTSAEAVERLAADIAAAFAKVEEWPERRGGAGFLDLLALRNMAPDTAATLRALLAERDALREALLTVASRHQGGHSEAGEVIAIALGLPFPLRMPAIDAARAALNSTKGTQP